jgi:hypothetical protein
MWGFTVIGSSEIELIKRIKWIDLVKNLIFWELNNRVKFKKFKWLIIIG